MTGSTDTPDLSCESCEVMLEQLDHAIERLSEKIENGRIRDPERDKVRLRQYRTLGYLVRTKKQVFETKSVEELEAEIKRLKQDRTPEPSASDASPINR